MIDISDDELVKMIVGAAFEVRKRLAQGYLESTYENAMMVELKMQGLEVENQVSMRVDYKGVEVGVFRADLLVEKRVIVENVSFDKEDVTDSDVLEILHKTKTLNSYIFNVTSIN